MKRVFCLMLAICISAVAFSQTTITDPNAEVRTVGSFTGISISDAFEVYISQGSDDAVAVSAADDDSRERISTEVKNGILIIGMNKSRGRWSGGKKMKAYISFKHIDMLLVSDASRVYLEGTLKADVLLINLSGASDLKYGKVDVTDLRVGLTGASDMRISGRAAKLAVDANGASKFKGEDLQTEICDANATGASDVRVMVNKELSARATGASDVRYTGDGVIRELKTSGAGAVKKI